MAYTTDLQQVLQYIRQGGKLKPAAGAAGAPSAQPAPTAFPYGKPPSGADKPKGRMPSGPPPKMSK